MDGEGNRAYTWVLRPQEELRRPRKDPTAYVSLLVPLASLYRCSMKDGRLTLLNPSLATPFRTTSMALEYTPFSAVCNLTLTRSKGWPTTTAQIPPTPPAAKDRIPEVKEDLVVSTTSVATCSLEGRASFEGNEGREELEEDEDEEEEEEEDMA